MQEEEIKTQAISLYQPTITTDPISEHKWQQMWTRQTQCNGGALTNVISKGSWVRCPKGGLKLLLKAISSLEQGLQLMNEFSTNDVLEMKMEVRKWIPSLKCEATNGDS